MSQQLAYRLEYFDRLQRWSFLLTLLAPIGLSLLGLLNAQVTGSPLIDHDRVVLWLAGSAGCVSLIIAMRSVRSLELHGWLTLALIAITSVTLALLATPTLHGALWMLPAILLVPVVAAPFWIWNRKNLLACLICYAPGFHMLQRTGADGALRSAYAALAAFFTLICVVIFTVIDKTRRTAYDNQRSLFHAAHHDALTGLPSRRRFQELGQSAVDHASRHGTALSIAFIDLDHFKRVNDRYSHAAGDRALESVAALMRAVVVKPALAARMGGEEFVLLLPGMTSSGALQFTRELAERVATRDLGGFKVTLSAGVAQLRTGESLSHVMHRADTAMLEAKRDGRARVVEAAVSS